MTVECAYMDIICTHTNTHTPAVCALFSTGVTPGATLPSPHNHQSQFGSRVQPSSLSPKLTAVTTVPPPTPLEHRGISSQQRTTPALSFRIIGQGHIFLKHSMALINFNIR